MNTNDIKHLTSEIALATELAIAKLALYKITQAYEADVYSLSDAIMIADKTLDTLDKMEKGVTI
jgi:hypothetical protein